MYNTTPLEISVAGARVELAIYGYEPHVIPFHHPAINVQLLTGVIQNQYWRHLDPAAQSAARAESFCFTRISQFIEISEMAETSQRLYSPVFFDSYNFINSKHKNKMKGVYAGVEPANYSLCIGLSLPFD